MKTANSIIGAFITVVLLMGVMFKIMHWPGAGPMIVLASGLLALFVYLVALANILNYKKNILLNVSNGLGAIVGSIIIVGFLFKLMHWPGAGPMIIVGSTLASFVFLLFMVSFIISKEPIRLSSGTFFSVVAFGILAFGVSVQGPSYSLLTSIVENNNKTELVIAKLADEMDFHAAESSHAMPYNEASYELHTHIENLKSKLYESTDGLYKEIADTISLENIMAKDNYDEPTRILGLGDPGNPTKVSGLEEFSGITLKEKIHVFNDKMKKLDPSFEPIRTDEKRSFDYLDSWETATFYHMPLAQVILTLNLIDAEALTKCNYYITKNYPTTNNQDGKQETK